MVVDENEVQLAGRTVFYRLNLEAGRAAGEAGNSGKLDGCCSLHAALAGQPPYHDL